MKRSFSVAFFLICIICGFYVGSVFQHGDTKLVSPVSGTELVQSTNIALTPTPIQSGPTPGIPATMSIPEIHLTTSVEQVGVDAQNRIDVPKKAIDVAWYDIGFRPGAHGNAIIDGHYDKVTGAPAAFYYVKLLQPGDQIVITDDTNKQYTFSVTQLAAYDYDKVPMQNLTSASTSAHLNLITCDGIWNNVTKNYSKRLVVYADLKK